MSKTQMLGKKKCDELGINVTTDCHQYILGEKEKETESVSNMFKYMNFTYLKDQKLEPRGFKRFTSL